MLIFNTSTITDKAEIDRRILSAYKPQPDPSRFIGPDRFPQFHSFKFKTYTLALFHIHHSYTERSQVDYKSLLSTVTNPVIVLGDFNRPPAATDMHDEFQLLTPATPTTVGEKSFDYAFVYPYANRQVEGTGGDLAVTFPSLNVTVHPQIMVDNSRISDHFMISFTLEFV